MRATVVAVLAVGALLAVSVPAVADHAYSHRYLVYGQIVDADGAPLEGVSVDFDFGEFSDYEGPCAQEGSGGTGRQQTTTGPMGRYFFCAHIHHSGSTAHDFSVRIGGPVPTQTQTLTSDPDIRRSQVDFQTDAEHPDQRGDTDAFNSSYRLRGIVWKPDDTRVDGITVNGVAIRYEDVDATIELPDGSTYEGDFVNSPFNTPQYNRRLQQPRENVTDRYGDFVFEWSNLPEDVSDGEVTVTTPDETVTEPLDPTYRHSTAAVVLPGEGPDLSFLWILAGLGGLGIVGYFAYEPVKDRWEEYRRDRRMRRLEEESDRKRS